MSSATDFPDLGHMNQEDRRIEYRVDTQQSFDSIKGDLFNVCNQLVYRYSGHNERMITTEEVPDAFEYQSLTGGITNRLFVCRYNIILNGISMEFRPLQVRLFGPHTDSVIDRTSELKVAKFISTSKAGPEILGSFLNGRLEGFIEGAKSLTPGDLLDGPISSSVAQAVGMQHKLKYPGGKHRTLWNTIRNWLSQARNARHHFEKNPERLALYDGLHLDALEKEVELLHTLQSRLDEPIVFCHNDLLSGNIMLVPRCAEERQCADDLAITLIDFEYGSPNYRAFDIANHFCECCGFDCVWENFPDEEHQRAFIRSYLRAYEGNDLSSALVKDHHAGKETGDASYEARVENQRLRVLGFSLAAHIFWSVWAVVMAVGSKINFDYLAFASLRLKGYYFMRGMGLSAVYPLMVARIQHGFVTGATPKPAINYSVIGFGVSGKNIQLPTVAMSEGGILRSLVMRHRPGESMSLYESRKKEAANQANLYNRMYGCTGLLLQSKDVYATQADRVSMGAAVPLNKQDCNVELRSSLLQLYIERVASASVDWTGAYVPGYKYKLLKDVWEDVETVDSVSALSSDVDVGIVATPPDTHLDVIQKLQQKGIFAQVDKPFLPTVSDCTKIDLSRVMCYNNRRFDGDFASVYTLVHNGATPWDTDVYGDRGVLGATKDSFDDWMHNAPTGHGITSGLLGCVQYAELAWNKGYMKQAWRGIPTSSGGGRIFDLGAHIVDQAQTLFKPHVPVAVFTLRDEHFQIVFSDGSKAVVDVSAMERFPKPRMIVTGCKASMRIESNDPQERTFKVLGPLCDAFDLTKTHCVCTQCAGRLPAAVLELSTVNPIGNTLPVDTVQGYKTRGKPTKVHDTTVFYNGRAPVKTASWPFMLTLLNDHLLGSGKAPQPVAIQDTILVISVIQAALKSAKTGSIEKVDQFYQ